MKNLNVALKKIIGILSSFKKLEFNNCSVKISDSQIITPIGDVASTLFQQKSKLKDQIIDIDLLKNLLIILDQNNSIIRLNHMGFGYKVTSQQEEKQRLIDLVKKTDQYLYEEESDDFGLWLFLGNTEKWEQPLIEFVPVEQDHPEIDYFLPHIQIDIDTTLNAYEIEHMVKAVFKENIKPYRLAISNGVACIVRNRLGIIDGVNIFLDIATNARRVELHRQNLLKKIS